MKNTKQQLSIFDEFEYQDSQINDHVFEVKDRVKVKQIKYIEQQLSIEDMNTLTLYGGQIGVVVSIHKGTVISYEVDFGRGYTAYFYSRELIPLD